MHRRSITRWLRRPRRLGRRCHPLGVGAVELVLPSASCYFSELLKSRTDQLMQLVVVVLDGCCLFLLLWPPSEENGGGKEGGEVCYGVSGSNNLQCQRTSTLPKHLLRASSDRPLFIFGMVAPKFRLLLCMVQG